MWEKSWGTKPQIFRNMVNWIIGKFNYRCENIRKQWKRIFKRNLKKVKKKEIRKRKFGRRNFVKREIWKKEYHQKFNECSMKIPRGQFFLNFQTCFFDWISIVWDWPRTMGNCFFWYFQRLYNFQIP